VTAYRQRAEHFVALVEAAFAMAAAVEVFTDENTGNGGWDSLRQ